MVPEEDGVVLLNPREIAFVTGTIGDRSIDCSDLIPPTLWRKNNTLLKRIHFLFKS